MNRSIETSLFVLLLSFTACGDDDASPGTDGGTRADADTPETDAGETPTDAGTTDADTSGCTRVALSGEWNLERADDVSVGFAAELDPHVAGTTGWLQVLFERYVPEPPVGTFTLGEGPNDNYGTCQECIALPEAPGGKTFFADRGTLTTTVDPYDRKLVATLTNVRLIEVTVDMFTRESTPVEDGACIELVDASVDQTFPPDGWSCDVSSFADGAACHCECGGWDPDCAGCGDPEFEPECEPLPVADCGTASICGFDPVEGGTACMETCDWAGREGCSAGICVYDYGAEGTDVCIDDTERLDSAMVGMDCTPSGLQRFCALTDGFSMGYCDEVSRCRPICQSDADCTVEGESCRLFVLGRPLGFCGPPPPTDG